MMKSIILAAAISCIAGSAFADGAVTGMVGGAATGAIVGGPIGAGVGAVVGGVTGSVIDPPPAQVVTYVQQAPAPAEQVIVREPVKVGVALPADVVVTPVPDNPKYGYVVMGQERVIVEPQTRRVVQIIE
ncbi:DUF1236 domain-containing protein [Rhizobium sp. MC63]|uniref:DUF1236 domain-containing protein n=1 Tax=Rhizobium mulingense TaxID=3031128 RepID=A0ACC6N1P9_9HYPH|nr:MULTISPECIES: DUF1236 domain-containing protein [Rhizobium]MDF0699195.1 DUF1236 domain-containing protein [Rhizobium sp. MC63]MEA3519514.1 DUF1236 domain-containing protein [Rhizobium sp. MJ31]MEB3046124.1 DUF1236 domain-containing protein [Rhizobium sp. MJ21]